MGQAFNIGLRQNFEFPQNQENQEDKIILFSCTSGSNKKIRTIGNQAKIVTYEDCRFNHGYFHLRFIFAFSLFLR